MESTFRGRWREAVRCWVGLHNIPEKFAVMEMGAVFRGGLCSRCFKVKVGRFLCNSWDDSQTEVRDGVSRLKGTNPLLISENYFVVDLGALIEVADERRAERDKKKKRQDGYTTAD